jgi:hypothetical protein
MERRDGVMEVREGSGIEHWRDRRDENGRMGKLKGRNKVEGEGFGLRQRQRQTVSNQTSSSTP